MADPLTLSVHALMGVSLAACAGLRAFMPLFVVGMLARMGRLPLGQDFQFLSTDAALIVFGIATVVEMVGDKFPAVDHGLDALGTFVKPVAATAVFASVMTELSPLQATLLGLMAAGGTATVMHVKKSSVRLVSSAGTLGMANPLLSTLEDLLCGVGIALSILVPLLAVLGGLLLLVAGSWLARRVKRALRRSVPVGP